MHHWIIKNSKLVKNIADYEYYRAAISFLYVSLVLFLYLSIPVEEQFAFQLTGRTQFCGQIDSDNSTSGTHERRKQFVKGRPRLLTFPSLSFFLVSD